MGALLMAVCILSLMSGLHAPIGFLLCEASHEKSPHISSKAHKSRQSLNADPSSDSDYTSNDGDVEESDSESGSDSDLEEELDGIGTQKAMGTKDYAVSPHILYNG